MNPFNIKRILVPVDFSATSEKVTEQAVMMSKKTNAEITLVTVIEGPFNNSGYDFSATSIYYGPPIRKMVTEWAEKHIMELKNALIKKGVAKVECKIEFGTPYKKIVEVAKKIKADIILMGTHGVSGFREYSIGSNAFRIVSETTCPVLSVQKHFSKPDFKQILLPFRDKAHSREGVDAAIAIAKLYEARVTILSINNDSSPSEIKKLQLQSEQVQSICEKQGVKCITDFMEGKFVSKLILGYAKKKKADLIVLMADLDKFAISEYIIGPVVQQIVNHSSVPILSMPPKINPKNFQYNNMF